MMERYSTTTTTYFLLLLTSYSSAATCPATCGGVNVTYPFGTVYGCFLPGFALICKNNTLIIPNKQPIQVLQITNGALRVNSSKYIARDCPGDMSTLANVVSVTLADDIPYTFTPRGNNLTVIGCRSKGHMLDENDEWTTECYTTCDQVNSTTGVGLFAGNEVCKTSCPNLRKRLRFSGGKDRWYGSCTYIFVAEEGTYKFNRSDLTDEKGLMDISMRMEWAVGDLRCKQAVYSTDYVCGINTKCFDAERGSGYLCKCLDGHEGNPYLNGSGGCRDIDECSSSSRNLCVAEARCKNRDPGFVCQCPAGSWGNGLRDQQGCNRRTVIIIAIAGSFFAAGTLSLCFAMFCWAKRRKKQRAKYFLRNGGILLKQCFHGIQSSDLRLFSANGLKIATDNYSKKRILGRGGQGTVYRGILRDGSIVAVKKSQEVAQSHIDQFINELVVLSQVSHKNIVRLLGCCLETEVPLLVYEFIPNGTLQQKLQECVEASITMSWIDRLQIATEIAEALCYLHSHESVPIFHRDIKSSNILLDQNCTPKLADFGISRIVAPDDHRVTTVVRGTVGYLDPEYFRTGKLTEKSDVYSFGVLLLELLTFLRPEQRELSRDYSDLVMLFFSCIDHEDSVLQIFEEAVARKTKLEELQRVAEIVSSCLSLRGDERPSMQAVAEKLALVKDEALTSEVQSFS